MRKQEILWQRIILFAVALLLVVLYFDRILDFAGHILGVCFPFILGAFLAFVFNVIANSLMSVGSRIFRVKDNRISRFLFNVAAILLFVLLVLLFAFVLFPRIVESLQRVAADLPASLNGFYKYLLRETADMPQIHEWINSLDFSMSAISDSMEGFVSWIASGSSSDLVGSVYNIVLSTFAIVFNTLLTIMFSVIVLFNKHTVVREGKALVAAYLPGRYGAYLLHVLDLIRNTFTAYIGGSCLECIILGTLVAFFASVFQLPYALLAGLVVGIGALVPMFGALFAAVLVSLVIALESPMQGLYFLILFICIQQVEGNFIYPNVVGKSVGLPPIYVCVAVTVGANVAGILGMIVFIPITSCLYQIVRENVIFRLEKRRQA